MNAKQARFVEEYLVDLNATQAAIRAGYGARTAKQVGARLLTNVDIADAIQAAQAARSERVELTQDYVLDNLTEIVERCMERAPVMVRRGREMVQLEDDEGRDVWQFNAKGALGALAMIGKHLGMFDGGSTDSPREQAARIRQALREMEEADGVRSAA